MTRRKASPIIKVAVLVVAATALALAAAACTPDITPSPAITPTRTPVPIESPTVTPDTDAHTQLEPTQPPAPTAEPPLVPDKDVDAGRIVRLTRSYDTESAPDWSPDGTKIVFECFDDGRHRRGSNGNPYIPDNHGGVRNWPIHSYFFPGNICVMNADGTGYERLTYEQGDDSDPEWSPDGRKIAFASYRDGGSDIYVMNADGSAVKQVTDDEFANEGPTWSPDGGKIAFSSWRDGSSGIYVINVDGSDLMNITGDFGYYDGNRFQPAWSPDGTKIAFAAVWETGGGRAYSGIFVINPDGTEDIQLYGTERSARSPAWSPDSNTIAFSSEQRPGSLDGHELYVVNIDGFNAGLERLTDRRLDDATPTWSPDGSKLAFVSSLSGNPEVYVMVDFRTHLQRLTDNTGNEHNSDSAPVWSPDGTRIAFSSNRDGDDELYIMNADGSGLEQLTDNDYEVDGNRFTSAPDDYGPAWSPDGSRIAYQSSQRMGYYDIFVINEDGSDMVKLTSSEVSATSRLNRALSWSPDGTRIAFIANLGRVYQAYIMNSDGTQESTVRLEDCQSIVPLGFFDDTGITWSPDGTKIAFSCRDSHIRILNLSDGTQTSLWACYDPVSAPVWSPDGTRIAFTCQIAGYQDVYAINIDDSDVTRLTFEEGDDVQPAWSPDGTKLAFATNRDGDYEIYILDLTRTP